MLWEIAGVNSRLEVSAGQHWMRGGLKEQGFRNDMSDDDDLIDHGINGMIEKRIGVCIVGLLGQ